MVVIQRCQFPRRVVSRLGCFFGSARLACVIVSLSPSLLGAVEPQVTQVAPRGLQLGSTTRIVVQGQHLDESTRILLPLPFPVETTVLAVHEQDVELHVSVPAEGPAGIYPLRVVTSQGVSNALAIGIDRLPQLAFRDTLVSLPVALHGELTGAETRATRFHGSAGQRLVVDLEGQRLGSGVRPVVRLVSPSDRLLGTARPSRKYFGDTRLVVELPEDGLYRVELQDVVFRGPTPGWFRLKLGDLDFADEVFPLAVPATGSPSVLLPGSSLTAAARVPPPSSAGQQVGLVAWPVDAAQWLTGAAPRVRYSEPGVMELNEASLRAAPCPPQVPLAINGQLLGKGEVDEYMVHVPAAASLRIELFAERWGSPLDAVLEVLDGDGKVLVRGDDQAGTADPGVDLDLPAAGPIRVRISSLIGRFGPEYAYRLWVGPRAPGSTRLVLEQDHLNLPAGARLVVPVSIERSGQVPDVQLSLTPALQAVVQLESGQILASDEVGLVALVAASDARGVFSARLRSLPDEARSGPRSFSLVTNDFPGAQYQPHLRDELALAVTSPAPLAVEWAPDRRPHYLARGTRRSLAVQLERTASGRGPVRLALLTTQRTPMKQEDNRQVEDVDRKLRLVEDTVLESDQTEATVTLIVPSDFPLHSWSFSLQADLLTEDAQQVRRSAFTPIRHWPAIEPVGLDVDLPETMSVPAGDEPGSILEGTVRRHPDFDLPVVVRLIGLDANDPPVAVTVPVGQSEFRLPLTFPAESKGGERKNVQLQAVLAEPDESQQAIRATTKPFQLKLE